MYKTAARTRLRIKTSRGMLPVEDLWDLTLTELNNIAKALNKKLKKQDEEDFLGENTKEDEITKLEFDIVIDILTTKKKERDAASTAADNKAHNQKILELIAAKEAEELKGKSIEELKGLLKE